MSSPKGILVVGIVAALGALTLAPAAPASTWNPTGEWAPFGECPLARGTIEGCVDTTVSGGSLTLHHKTIPLINAIALQGGYEGSPLEFFGAENGQTLSKPGEPVPGGLVGVTAPISWPLGVQEWFNTGIGEGLTGVTATIELIRPATQLELSLENLALEENTALALAVRVHLDNPLLGTECFIGSSTEPIQLDLSSGKSGSLKGSAGTIAFNGSFTLVTFTGVKLVDGTFSAPEATGCGGVFSAYVNPLINSIYGLGSGPGENSAVLEGDLSIGEASEVRTFAMP
jgi:hypothetical protein